MRDPHTGELLSLEEWQEAAYRTREVEVYTVDTFHALSMTKLPYLFWPMRKDQEAHSAGKGASSAPYVRRVFLSDYERAHSLHPTPATARMLDLARRSAKGDTAARHELAELDPNARKLLRESRDAHAFVAEASAAPPERDLEAWLALPRVIHDLLRENRVRLSKSADLTVRELSRKIDLLAPESAPAGPKRGFVPPRPGGAAAIELLVGRRTLAARLGSTVSPDRAGEYLRVLTDFWALRTGLEAEYVDNAVLSFMAVEAVDRQRGVALLGELAGTPLDPTWQRQDAASKVLWDEVVRDSTDYFLEAARAAGSEGFYQAARGVLERQHAVVWEFLGLRQRRRVIERAGVIDPTAVQKWREMRREIWAKLVYLSTVGPHPPFPVLSY